MALMLVGAGVRAGVKAYKAFDKKQKEKKEQQQQGTGSSGSVSSNMPNMEGLQLNDPSYPSQTRAPASVYEADIPQGYRDEKKSREYNDGKQIDENPFDAPPSYDKAIETDSAQPSSSTSRDYASAPTSAPEPERYAGGFGSSDYPPQSEQRLHRTRSNSSSSSSSSSSSASSKEIRHRNPGLTRYEAKALRRQNKYERKLARRQAKAEKRARRDQHRIERDMKKYGVRTEEYGQSPLGMGTSMGPHMGMTPGSDMGMGTGMGMGMGMGMGRGGLGGRGGFGRGRGGGPLGRGVW
ncbi:uncharacterized protein I303_108641 [Kwoniella dejecticola CBS 10117]|uniref:Uncharacterized protein n=1 Tax=Kwoniella dejecticola CBS 10117 TaxID=1296121 RepID=A0A1A5ZWU5_9TREE|nr:uncharacterized protein I303_07034 [Kwoniella dejecticola CBS 10117]OBR82275.1 hypothetical protein I303_07034 [Kwoniella dejecticola CBS 10117]